MALPAACRRWAAGGNIPLQMRPAASRAAVDHHRARLEVRVSETSCLFCRIVSGEVPAERVLETVELIAFRDINPQAPVHVLIIPREHIPSLDRMEESHARLVGRLHLAARDLARREGIAEGGWRVVTNVGPDAGQTVPHLHLHLLGGRRMGWPPG